MGVMTMLLRGGKGSSRTAGKIPGAENLTGFHWSPEGNLVETNPAMYGRGIKGAEAGRLAGQNDIRPRSYFYTNETMKEGGLGPHQYSAKLEDVYPKGDPLGLRAAARKSNPDDVDNAFERAVKAKGFKGYEGGDAVVYFERAPVSKHTKSGIAPRPTEARPTITDTQEVRAGSRTGHMVGAESDPEYQEAAMRWMENSNRAYPKLGLQGEAQRTAGYYRPPGGEVERNPLTAYSMPYSPEAEEAVDLYGTLRAVMAGQNARGFSGVRPGSGGNPGLRINMAGHTQPQVEGIIQDVEKAGGLAIPHGEGLNVGSFGGTPDDLLAVTHDSMKRHGVPAAQAYQGELRSGYDEFDWSKPGSGTITREHLIPKLLRNPDLTNRLEMTGEVPQLARGLSAAERNASLRGGFQPREDLTNLRNILQQGGLRGLLDRVEKQGYAGLPAAALFALPRDQEGN